MSASFTRTYHALWAAVDAYGVGLPAAVTALRDVPLDLPDLAETKREAVESMVSALGKRNYAATRDAALDRVARAQAGADLRPGVHAAIERARRVSITTHAGEIIDAFRDAVADDCAALTEAAQAVPARTTATTHDLDGAGQVARVRATEIDARLSKVTTALAPLYGATHARGPLPAPAVQRLMLVDLPEDLDPEVAERISVGVRGLRLATLHGGDRVTRADGAPLWWAAVSTYGVTFRLGDVADFEATAARMVDAATPQTAPGATR